MIAVSLSRPLTAAFADKVQYIMDVILHIGAQRTATTSFQAYMRANSANLSAQGIGYWGPHRTRRGGVLSPLVSLQTGAARDGVIDETRDLIARYVGKLKKRGKTHLIVSDENMLGTARANVRSQCLYPETVQRLDRFARVFEGVATRVVVSIRAFDTYWPSALAFSLARGARLPSTDALERIVAQPRSWRNVIEDTARAFPGVEVQVDDFKSFASHPAGRLSHMVDAKIAAPLSSEQLWLNRSPDLAGLRAVLRKRGVVAQELPSGEGRWQPFDALQIAILREKYADDLFWLHAGADGLATYIKNERPDQTGKNLSGGTMTRGQNHDRQDGRLARTG